jgi:signal transduction histidine kinase
VLWATAQAPLVEYPYPATKGNLPRMPRRLIDLVLIGGLAAVYLLAARLGLAFDALAGFATLVWPPTGISLAALLLLGYRVWPGVLIGAAAANFFAGAPLAVALGIGAGNTAEALVGAYLLRRIPGFSVTLENASSVLGLIALAALCSTLLSATVGVASLSAGGLITQSQVQETWRAWWIGDMVGVLLVTPIILVWSNAPRARFRHHLAERIALAAAVVVAGVVTFFSGMAGLPGLATPFHYTDLLFAVLIWAALRFGQRGAATAAFLLSVIAVAGTARGYGPFAVPELHHGLLSLQTFMALVVATVLLLGGTIAERRRARDEARQARDDAEHANLAKSEFLAVMSHELRTPLNAIAGYSQLLETGVYGPMTEKQRDAVARIHRSEERLLALIDEVLGFARAEKGQVTVTRENVRVAETFDVVESLVKPECRRKHVALKRDLARPRLAVQADPKSLQQILVSLLSNASKYTAEGGMITLGADREGETVRIWVRDTGVGISADKIQRVFDPFFQANGGTTRRFDGVGLGLTIARDLARRMEGEVTIDSAVGRGTTASVVLPAA